MDALEAIFTRRSTRMMKKDVPERSLIEQVLEAGRCAPSGSNSRKTHFIVITDQKILNELTELVRNEFAGMELTEDTYVSLRNSIRLSKAGTYIFHYGAQVLIVTANEKGYGNAMADSACALENMMIAANALDLGSCWINQLHWLDENPGVRSFLKKLGLEDHETVTGGLILGYAKDGLPVRSKGSDHGNPVTWIE
jgi:nitroreductase